MIRSAIMSVTVAAVLLAAVPARSHHSNVAFEVTKIITITGVVKEFQWVNPHTFVHVMVDDGKGGRVEWVAEGRAPGVLRRAGWSPSSIKEGETITIDMSPAKDGTRTGLIARVTKSDGTILGNQPAAQ
jgi:hypothetical protein